MKVPLLARLAVLATLSFTAGCTTTQARARDFSLRTLDGSTVRLSDHLGRDVVLLTFWATWCTPCLAEMPNLERLHRTYQQKGLTLLSVAMDGPETLANVEPTARRYGVTFPVLLDEETRVTAVYNPARDAPFTVLFGRDGTIAETRVGFAPGDEKVLEEHLLALMGQAAPEPAK